MNSKYNRKMGLDKLRVYEDEFTHTLHEFYLGYARALLGKHGAYFDIDDNSLKAIAYTIAKHASYFEDIKGILAEVKKDKILRKIQVPRMKKFACGVRILSLGERHSYAIERLLLVTKVANNKVCIIHHKRSSQLVINNKKVNEKILITTSKIDENEEIILRKQVLEKVTAADTI